MALRASAGAIHSGVPWSCKTSRKNSRMDRQQDTTGEALLEHLIKHGPDDIASVFGCAFELAMRIERKRFLGAGRFERTAERRRYANG